MRLPLILILVVGLFSCSKKEDTAEAGTLTGRWQLTEYYVSPGGGDIQWQDADPQDPSFVEFTLTGKMIFTSSTQPQRVFDYDTTAPGRITATKDGVSVQWGYEFDGEKLILSGGGCIEACLFKYRSVPTQSLGN